MNKTEWQNELHKTRINRYGIGMYTLDTFDEEVSEILSLHDKELIDSILENIRKSLDEKNNYSKKDIINILNSLQMNNMEIEEDFEIN